MPAKKKVTKPVVKKESMELKPCPFCGSKAEIRRLPYTKELSAICTKCNVHGDSSKYFATALKRWNRRSK